MIPLRRGIGSQIIDMEFEIELGYDFYLIRKIGNYISPLKLFERYWREDEE